MWTAEAPPLKIPHHFFNQRMAADTVGAIVFEDLSRNSAQVIVGEGINLEQTFRIADNLAAIQAWSLRNNIWQDRFSPISDEAFKKVPNVMKAMLEEWKVTYPEFFDPLFDSFDGMYTKPEDSSYYMSVLKEMDMPPAVLLVDCWVGNALFKKIETPNGLKASNDLLAILDWQV